MNIVFFGTSPFGLPTLEALTKSRHKIVAIFTTPDKAQGRNLLFHSSPVKRWAQDHQIHVHDMEKSTMSELLPTLRDYKADVFVVISFGVILSAEVLSTPRLASLNVHSSLLPRYRGPAPIHWAIWNGDAETGVTVMRMAETLDTGDILRQAQTPIPSTENVHTLEERLALMGGELLMESLDLLENGKAVWIPQDESKASYARKITKDDARIPWSESADAILRRIRALVGWPGTYTLLHQKRLLIIDAHRSTETDALTSQPGTVLAASPSQGLVIQTANGAIVVDHLQMEGKKPMLTADFLRGNAIKVGDILH